MPTSPKGGRCPFHLGQLQTLAHAFRRTFDCRLRPDNGPSCADLVRRVARQSGVADRAVSTRRRVAPSSDKTGEINQAIADAICRNPQFLCWRAGSIDPESWIPEPLCTCYIPAAERCKHYVAATQPERFQPHLVRTWIWLECPHAIRAQMRLK